MKKKTAIVMISLLTLTVLLTTPLYVPQSAAGLGPYHYKIKLSQMGCDAKVEGNLTDYLENPIANFCICCCQGYAEWKVQTHEPVDDIEFYLFIDLDKDCEWDAPYNPQYNKIKPMPMPYVQEWIVYVGKEEKKVKLEVTELEFPLHWKIALAQKNCNAIMSGFLSDEYQLPISDAEFELNCTCGGFVFAKVDTPYCTLPRDINFTLQVDWNKDGIIDNTYKNKSTFEQVCKCKPDQIVRQWPWQWVKKHPDWPTVHKMVVVEVEEQDPEYFEWQLTMKQHGCEALWTGNLTRDGFYIPGTDFNIYCNRTLQCKVVRTEWCTVPNDIDSRLLIIGMPSPVIIIEPITQFPWTKTVLGPGPGVNITLELTEVQMHRYILMLAEMDSSGSLGPRLEPIAEWKIGDWEVGAGTPHATRAPDLFPLLMGHNITFTQKDPITGIVKLGVPAESYVGYSHVWFGNDTGVYYNMSITMEEQGCGYLFTGEGKNPILGDVDLITRNNDTGVYNNETGELIELGPCLQDASGLDGIPGTGDPGDSIGDGTPDPPGSSILYLPCKMATYLWAEGWNLLFASPWPQLMTTGKASDIVIQPDSPINGANYTLDGEPWEFVAGIDHKKEGYNVTWKHEKCNAYVTYVCAWSVLGTMTTMGNLDVMFYISQKAYREDCLIADINCDEKINIKDIGIIAVAFGGLDESLGNPFASPNYKATGDLMKPQGKINIKDIGRVAIDFGAQLTPNCIKRP